MENFIFYNELLQWVGKKVKIAYSKNTVISGLIIKGISRNEAGELIFVFDKPPVDKKFSIINNMLLIAETDEFDDKFTILKEIL
jgi:hypothetical protein